MSLERVYSIDWLRVICKGSKGLIYLLALTWLQWFTRTSKLKVRTAGVLLFIGLPLLLAGIFLDLLGEFFYLSPLVKRIAGEIILANAGTALVLYSLVLMVVELARTSCQYQREAESDPLTGLYNRRAFFAAADCVLKEASAGRRSPALAILDLDNMKEINDTWGHQCGDEALKQAARAIQKSVREGDVVARYGGDEFVILFPDKGPRLETLRARLEKHLKAICFSGAEIPLSLSVGLARFPADGKDVDTLLAVADARMYADKEAKSGYKRNGI
ncbi:diguanylate cyclase (GGDEF) domain-containing protein [Thermanaeromonas toyohensis ToBE]|uniref:Diguanylate cyclase (GGDEF) domain-containing protein n=1 Tax=Thermanaeromonas toyohensis ToBE TaxID=698762 RepID=A0A1W1W2D8_9FIRM|nr:GGDEF domain-containing protein [Thermanaeromonas toyohensis]SMB99789.1 diguanylate cyclase (GGDEF) domain-containing protein [Thermanaeromonas toyohensis ToBE]